MWQHLNNPWLYTVLIAGYIFIACVIVCAILVMWSFFSVRTPKNSVINFYKGNKNYNHLNN